AVSVTWSVQMRKVTRFSLRNRLLFFFLFFASVPILAFSYWTLQSLSTQSENTVLEHLQALAKTKAAAIESFSQSRLRNIEKLSELTDIVQNVKVLSAVTGAPAEVTDAPPPALEKEGGGLPQSIEETRIDEAKAGLDPRKPIGPTNPPVPKKVDTNPKVIEARTSLKKTLSVILAD